LTVPIGSELEFGLVIVGGAGGLMVSVKFCSSNCGIESVTRSLKLNEPVLVGVPEIFPFEALRSSPGGNAPLVTPHTRDPIPPVTETV
jgi:hypothetical protein